MALVRTDYGLIYNTDGSLCATLLPEGGVAVEEATENLVPDGDVEKTGSALISSISYALDVATFKQLEGKVLTVSIDVIDKYDGKHVIDIYLRREDAEGGVVEGTRSSPIHVTSEYRRVSYTFTLPELGTITKLYLYIRGNTYVPGGGDNTGTYTVKNAQIENKPYDTSFVNGIRPPGRLAYPSHVVLDPREGAIRFKFIPLVVQNWNNYFFMSSLSNGRFVFFLTQSGVGLFDYGAANSGVATPEGVFQARQEYDVVLRWSINTGKQAIFVNGIKYEQDLPNGVADDFPAQISTVDNYATVIKELCFFKRYPSDDEIRTWHSLDAPFFDPNDRIDAAARPIYAPGTTIGAKGLVVDKNGVDQVAVGDISGRQWRGSPLPSGTFGLWAPDGFIAVSENESIIVADAAGVHTTSTSWQDIPGFTVTITVKDSAAIFITARFNARVRTSTDANIVGYFRLLRNEVQLDLATIGINTGGSNITLRTPVMCSYLDKQNAGTYQYKCQFRSISSGVEVSSFDRELIINVMKR